VRFVVLGGGPAGVQAASYAARLGAKVTVVEKDVLGGAANLWDCIPSKAMIATGGLVSLSVRAAKMGVNDVKVSLDLDEIRARIAGITQHLERSNAELLRSQGVEVVEGEARFLDPHRIAVRGRDGHDVEIEGDAFLISTGSRPRVPDWATVDGKRVLTTRQAYPPPDENRQREESKMK